MSRITLVHRALIGVVGALILFLLAAGARVLRGGRGGCSADHRPLREAMGDRARP